MFDRILSPYTLVQTLALRVLVNGGERPRDLAQQLGMTTQNVTSITDRLVRSGYITREREVFEKDRRGVRLTVTEKGKQAALHGTSLLTEVLGKVE